MLYDYTASTHETETNAVKLEEALSSSHKQGGIDMAFESCVC